MRAATHATAPLGEGWLPCTRCHRYRHPDDLLAGKCRKPNGCVIRIPSPGQRAATAMTRAAWRGQGRQS